VVSLKYICKTKILFHHDGERFNYADILSTAIGLININGQEYSQIYIAKSTLDLDDEVPIKDLIERTEERALNQVKQKLERIRDILDLARQERWEIVVKKDC